MVVPGSSWAVAVALGVVVGAASYQAGLKLSRQLSPAVSKTYAKLPLRQRGEWDVRVPSTVHAVVIAGLAAYLYCFTDDLSDVQGDAVPMVLKTSPLSNFAMGFSLGYFTIDLLLLFWHYPAFGGFEMAVHHAAAWISICASLVHGEGHAYTLAMLFTECTTPFVNARWMLDVAGMKFSRVYLINGLSLLAAWALGRILFFILFFVHVYEHQHQLPRIALVIRVLLLGIPVLLFMLNILWFVKILRGARKLLFPKNRDEKASHANHANSHLVPRDSVSKLVPGLRQRM